MSFSRLNINGFTLKVLAIIGMTCNHIAHAFMPVMPYWVTFAIYSLGGLTYPIMSFILVEGYLHTSNLRKYASRLAIFALVSQIPFTLMFGWTANVLFTLLIALGLLWAYDHIAPNNKGLFFVLLIAAEAISLRCDWAIAGPLIPLFFYMFRHLGARGIAITMVVPYLCIGVPDLILLGFDISANITHSSEIAAQIAADASIRRWVELSITGEPLFLSINGFGNLCGLGYALIGFSLAWFFILFYNGKRGRSMKWFFYAYYPLHLMVIWVLYVLIVRGGNFTAIIMRLFS